MAVKPFNITVPGPGEPIDLTFMTTLAEYIKQINQYMVAEKQSYSSMYTGKGIPRKKLETEDVSIWTGTHILRKVAKGSTTNQTQTWTVNYGSEITFNSIPVVTATPKLSVGAVSNSCWITGITSSSATGKFRFNEKTTRDETPEIFVMVVGAGIVNLGW